LSNKSGRNPKGPGRASSTPARRRPGAAKAKLSLIKPKNKKIPGVQSSSRVGKIARLPEAIREEINGRLQDGQTAREILGWLNSCAKVKSALAREFGGRPVNAVNLSAWRRGGFRDWQCGQLALAEARRMMAEGRELARTGGGNLADVMAAWLMGRYMVASRQLLREGNEPARWKLTREMCHDLVALRRGDHGRERLRLAGLTIKLLKRKQESDRAALKAEVLKERPQPEQFLSPEEREAAVDQILGLDQEYSQPSGQEPREAQPDPDGSWESDEADEAEEQSGKAVIHGPVTDHLGLCDEDAPD